MHVGGVGIEVLVAVAESAGHILSGLVYREAWRGFSAVGAVGIYVFLAAFKRLLYRRRLPLVAGSDAPARRNAVFGSEAEYVDSLVVGGDVAVDVGVGIAVAVAHVCFLHRAILVVEAQYGLRTDDARHTGHDAPRCTELPFEVVHVAVVDLVGAADAAAHAEVGLCEALLLEVVVGGGVDSEAEAKLVDRAYYGTDLEVEPAAPYMFPAVKAETAPARGGADGVSIVVKHRYGCILHIFGVVDALAVLQICDAESHAPVDDVADVAAEVDGIFVGIALLLRCKRSVARCAVLPHALIVGGASHRGDHERVVGQDAHPRGLRVEIGVVVGASREVAVAECVLGRIAGYEVGQRALQVADAALEAAVERCSA